jgi:hypothetical protein
VSGKQLLVLVPLGALVCAAVAAASSLSLASAKLGVFTSCTLDSASGGIDDAYTDQNQKNATHNTAALEVNSSTQNKNEYTFIAFTSLVNACPALAGASIKSATLTLTMTTAPANAKTYTVSRVDPASTWTQSTLTWNNQPGVVSTTTTFASGTTAGTRTADVTSDVTLFASGTTSKGWRIADLGTTTTDLGAFASAESGTTANRPRLTVNYVH